MMTSKPYKYSSNQAWIQEVESWSDEGFTLPEPSLDGWITTLADHVSCTLSSGCFADLQLTMIAYEAVYELMDKLDVESDYYMTLESRIDNILPFWFVYWQQTHEEQLNKQQPTDPLSLH